MIRLLHISDIHITAPLREWQIQDYLNKRIAGWINHRWLGRRFRFRHGETVLRKIFHELRRDRPNHIIFSGDATALGFESELRIACDIMGVAQSSAPPGLAVPGNHDYATRAAASSGLFEYYFSPWQQGIRVDGAKYPFAQSVGDYWLIGVNSSSGNRWAWDASGRVGRQQIERFRYLLDQLDSRPRILVTHYPVCLSSGRKEIPWRGLRDLKRFMNVAVDGGICLWLHGHRHKGYHLPRSKLAPFPVICAGSATQTRRWSHCEYELDGDHIRCTRRVFDPKTSAFRMHEAFDISLRTRVWC